MNVLTLAFDNVLMTHRNTKHNGKIRMNREDWDERMKEPRDEVKPLASDVANDIMNDVLTEYDITIWKTLTDAEMADGFRDIIAIIAAFKFDHDLPVLENRSTLLFEIQDYCERFLTEVAKQEGYN